MNERWKADLDRWITRGPPEPDDEDRELPPEQAYPGLRSMSEAPRDRAIIGILHDEFYAGEDARQKVFYGQVGIFGDELWFDADGDGATDNVWKYWATDQFIGWLPLARAAGK